MKYLLAFAAVVWLTMGAGCANIAVKPQLPVVYTYTDKAGKADMLDAPCESKRVLDQIPHEYHEAMRAARGTFQGKSFEACWIDVGEIVVIVWEDGDKGRLPKELLQGGKGA